MAPLVAGVVAARGAHALVFRGDDGLDELTTATTSRVWSVAGGEVAEASFDPARLGIAPATDGALTRGELPADGGMPKRLASRYGGERLAITGDTIVFDQLELVRNRTTGSAIGVRWCSSSRYSSSSCQGVPGRASRANADHPSRS